MDARRSCSIGSMIHFILHVNIQIRQKEAADMKRQKSDFRINAVQSFTNESHSESYYSLFALVLTNYVVLFEETTAVSEGRCVVLDTETTGFSHDDCIVEIGAVEIVIKDNQVVRTGSLFQSYINPSAKVHPMAFKVVFTFLSTWEVINYFPGS